MTSAKFTDIADINRPYLTDFHHCDVILDWGWSFEGTTAQTEKERVYMSIVAGTTMILSGSSLYNWFGMVGLLVGYVQERPALSAQTCSCPRTESFPIDYDHKFSRYSQEKYGTQNPTRILSMLNVSMRVETVPASFWTKVVSNCSDNANEKDASELISRGKIITSIATTTTHDIEGEL
ncbi:predicted protein [Sclerotinia sclerotiorum 1980 UF-70]|uniref:Uncharacterized protein n=1 Tax=Sclerotinia sclerotiorum (strain ATCC 18683 / 1980 / Ss-1) TaxID=665079 RepID=A7E433_SCLS1|nr:predicted protein [Sclerotinia sclerotiorum 1980 UF-70]EDN90655.1 predicted protein [Sclerotinia sclerotiorum 1980 UF-70]